MCLCLFIGGICGYVYSDTVEATVEKMANNSISKLGLLLNVSFYDCQIEPTEIINEDRIFRSMTERNITPKLLGQKFDVRIIAVRPISQYLSITKRPFL